MFVSTENQTHPCKESATAEPHPWYTPSVLESAILLLFSVLTPQSTQHLCNLYIKDAYEGFQINTGMNLYTVMVCTIPFSFLMGQLKETVCVVTLK